jgi:hypothetical protein
MGLLFQASEIELSQLRSCAAGEDIRSSDRPGNKARQRLRRAGLLSFNSKIWRWEVTEEGKRFIEGRNKIDALRRSL